MKQMLFVLLFFAFTNAATADPNFFSISSPQASGNNIPISASGNTSVTVNYHFWIPFVSGTTTREVFVLKVQIVAVNPNDPNDVIPISPVYEHDSQNYTDRITYNPSVSIPAAYIGKKLGLQYTWGSSGSNQPNGPITDGVIFMITGSTSEIINGTPFATLDRYNNRVNVVAVANNNNYIRKWYTGTVGAPFSSWFFHNYDAKYATAMSKDASSMDFFMLGVDNQLYYQEWKNTSSYSVFWNLGSNFASPPRVQARESGRVMDIFAIGLDNHLYSKWWDKNQSGNSAGGWSTWMDMGGNFVSSFAPAILTRSGAMDVFVLGSDNHLYSKWWNQSTSVWSAWMDFGGDFSSPPAAHSKDGVSMDLFVIGTNNHLYAKWWTSSTSWSMWADMGGGFNSTFAPATTVRDNGNSMDVYAVGTDGHLYTRWWTRSSGSWSAWSDLGGQCTSAPSAIVHNGAIYVFVKGADDRVYFRLRPQGSTVFTGWAAI